MTVKLPQASNERTFHAQMSDDSSCIVVQKYVLGQCFNLSFVIKFPSNFRLVFLQNRSYQKECKLEASERETIHCLDTMDNIQIKVSKSVKFVALANYSILPLDGTK